MKKILIITFVFLSFANISAQEVSPLREKIIEYFDISGGQKNFETVIDQMIDMQKESLDTEDSNEFFEELSRELKAESISSLYDMLVPIYANYVTEEELDAAIAYYNSPLGKSLVAKNPEITKESMQAGFIWGQELGEKVVKKMENNKKNE